MRHQRGITASLVILLLVAVIIIAAVGFLYLIYQTQGMQDSATTSTGGNESVVTSDPSAYFPNGYYSHIVNLSLTHSGDLIVVGNVSFLYITPTNLETRTMTMGSSATTTVAVVTADYQCGTSMGQQRFFFVQVLNGGTNGALKLDYCLTLNTAISQGAYQGGTARPWDLWQVSSGLGPNVAIHMTGKGENVSLVELCVEK